MKRKDWFFVITVLLICILADQITKNWASALVEKMSFGIIRITLIHNKGAMLGLFSDLPAVLRIVTMSTSGVFILCLYSLIQYIIPRKLMSLRYGLSILVGGILGNVLDRIFYGHVIDFMAVQIYGWHSPIWNVADIIQWVGYFIMTYALLKYREQLWPDQNDRKNFWVNKKFQIKYSIFFTTTGILLTLISMVFSYTYLKVTIQELVGLNQMLIDKFTKPFLYTFIILSLIFSIILFSIGKFISHRIAGPLYAFERFLSQILDGDGLTKNGAALKLRTGDDFKHLEELAEQIKIKIHKINLQKKQPETKCADDQA